MFYGNISLACNLEISLKVWGHCLCIVSIQTAGQWKILGKCLKLPPLLKKTQANKYRKPYTNQTCVLSTQTEFPGNNGKLK